MEDLKQFLSNIQNFLILLKADEPDTSQNMVLNIMFFSIFGIHDNPVLFVNLRLMLIEDTKLHKFSKNGKNNRNVCQLKASLGVEFSD